MKKRKEKLITTAVALAICIIILLFARFIAISIKQSKALRQNQFISELLDDDGLNLEASFDDPERIKIIEKFLVAVTKAYVDFELIPYREWHSLASILRSYNDKVNIAGFSYSGKDIIITGTASDEKDVREFAENLESTDYFKEIRIDRNVTIDGGNFEIVCISKNSGEIKNLLKTES